MVDRLGSIRERDVSDGDLSNFAIALSPVRVMHRWLSRSDTGTFANTSARCEGRCSESLHRGDDPASCLEHHPGPLHRVGVAIHQRAGTELDRDRNARHVGEHLA